MSSEVTAPEATDRQTDLERLPSFLLNHIVHQYHQILQTRLKSAGVSTLKMRIVLSLRTYGRLTVGELCNYAIAEQPTMSRALDSLEAQGHVRREHSESDSRLRLVSLTELGKLLYDRIHPEILRVNAAMIEGMAQAESGDFIRQLGLVLTNLRKL